MKKEIADRWVAALRDPEAKQLKGSLGNTIGERCCLGVLSDIAVADGVISPPMDYERSDCKDLSHGHTLEYGIPGGHDSQYTSHSQLVLPVREWSGVKTANGTIVGVIDEDDNRGIMFVLASMNDAGTPFSQIADMIEHYWEEL